MQTLHWYLRTCCMYNHRDCLGLLILIVLTVMLMIHLILVIQHLCWSLQSYSLKYVHQYPTGMLSSSHEISPHFSLYSIFPKSEDSKAGAVKTSYFNNLKHMNQWEINTLRDTGLRIVFPILVTPLNFLGNVHVIIQGDEIIFWVYHEFEQNSWYLCQN